MDTSRMPPEVSEEQIRTLVQAFYGKIRCDAVLGPIFESVIADEWDAHLARMCDFWSSVMRTTGRYKGNPMAAHLRLETVRPEHFAYWLTLFQKTALEVCPPDIAMQFCARAQTIARSLQLGMFYRPRVSEVAGPVLDRSLTARFGA
jgi:hemoglobin